MKANDLIGQRFGMLTVVSRAANDKDGKAMWNCVCDCGRTKDKPVKAFDLRSGKVVSCGCYLLSVLHGRKGEAKKHGMSNSRLFNIWKDMRARCYNPNDISYKRYGAKGITVCDEWLDSANFIKWALNNGYSDELSIDRIDNSKGYCPDNCRWATRIEQCNNRTNNRIVTYKGENFTLAELARKLNLHPYTLLGRIKRGWDENRLAEKPDKTKRRI